MKLKRFAAALVVAGLLSSSFNVSATGIPVVDVAGNLQEMQHWLARVKQWTETAAHYRSQLEAYKNQLATQTGLRDIVGLVNQGKSLKNDLANLQRQGISLNDLLVSGNAPTGALESLYNKYKAFDVCDAEQAAAYLSVCKQETVNKAYAVEQTVEVQNSINETLDDISNLSDRIANAQDSKESMDLANAIQVKSVRLNTLTSQWEMNMKAAEQRDKLLAAKREKAHNQQQLEAPVMEFN